MNKKQRLVMVFGLSVFMLAGLFPPYYWVFPRESIEARFSAGEQTETYAALFFPPRTMRDNTKGFLAARVDRDRLLIEWVLVTVLTGVLCVVFASPRSGGGDRS